MRLTLAAMREIFTTQRLLICGAAFIAYCIYFDYRRRNAPDYREKVTERRRAKQHAATEQDNDEGDQQQVTMEQLQMIIAQELRAGEQLAKTDPASAARHIANAIRLHPDPNQFAALLRPNLPDDIFTMAIQIVNSQQ
eukprot:m.227143 g.227143  ORF g.227143 m.227143 type:complete len:138 (+) comp17125_c0_seq1:241-654(+)